MKDSRTKVICIVRLRNGSVLDVHTYIVKHGDRVARIMAEMDFSAQVRDITPGITPDEVNEALNDGKYTSPRLYEDVFFVDSDVKYSVDNHE